jgi:hypothetical protein
VTESRNALRNFDSQVSSFIFPNNDVAFLDLIKDAGFTAYRAGAQQPLARDPYGLWRFPKGMWLSPRACSVREILALADIAAAQRQLVHAWCHLHEFRSADEAAGFFSALLEGVAARRERGLEVRTMRNIVASEPGG